MEKLRRILLVAVMVVVATVSASAQSTMTVANGSYTIGEMVSIPVILDNRNHMTGFQFDVIYPESWAVKVVKGENLKKVDEDDENLFALKWKNNTCLVYSDTAEEIESGEVAIIQITDVTNGTLKLTRIKGAGSGQYAVTTEMEDIVIEFKNGKYFNAQTGENPNSIIYYTSSDGNIVTPYAPDAFGANIFSNTYENGQGKIVFDGEVTMIGEEAFMSCLGLTSVTIPNSVTTIGIRAFSHCEYVPTVNIPNSVTKIDKAAFEGMHRLTSFTGKFASEDNRCLIINGNLNAFAPAGLTSYTIPNTVTSIGASAFHGGVNLTSVEIPNSVTSIGDSAFANCPSLASIVCKAVTPPACKATAFAKVPVESCRLIVPYQNVTDYATLVPWNGFTNLRNEAAALMKIDEYRNLIMEKIREIEDFLSNKRPNDLIDTIRKECSNILNETESELGLIYDMYCEQLLVHEHKDEIEAIFTTAKARLEALYEESKEAIAMCWVDDDYVLVTNDFEEGELKTIAVAIGGHLTISGDRPLELDNVGLYFNETNPATLLNENNATIIAREAYVEFGVEANQWYFITPVADVVVDSVRHYGNGAFVFREYDASKRASGKGDCWVDVTSNLLTAGQGYIFRSNASGRVEFPLSGNGSADLFRNDDVVAALESHPAASIANEDWNFIGNPYPCYFNIQLLEADAPITVREGDSYVAFSVKDDDYALRPMQSFFMQKSKAAENIVFHKEGRMATRNSSNRMPRQDLPTQHPRHLFDITITDGKSTDRTRVVFNDEAAMEYERNCDAAKFISEEKAVPQIFTIDKNIRYAINERPLLNGVVPLGISVGSFGTYTISLGRGNGSILLYDADMNRTIDLSREDYEFTADEGECHNRFHLVFGQSTGIEEIKTSCLDQQLYNLNGQRVGKEYKGITVSRGKTQLWQSNLN